MIKGSWHHIVTKCSQLLERILQVEKHASSFSELLPFIKKAKDVENMGRFYVCMCKVILHVVVKPRKRYPTDNLRLKIKDRVRSPFPIEFVVAVVVAVERRMQSRGGC